MLCLAWHFHYVCASRQRSACGGCPSCLPRSMWPGAWVFFRVGLKKTGMKTTLTELGNTPAGNPPPVGAATPPIWKGIIPRLQLQISERRLLMMFGDAMAILASIVIALYGWSLTAAEPFNLEFILWRAIWFIVLPFLW